MGKASRWLRSIFLMPGGRKGRKQAGNKDADCQSVLSAPLPTTHAAASAPSGRERRRWSFRRPGAAAAVSRAADAAGHGQGALASSSSHCFSEAEVHVVVAQDQHHAVAAAIPEAPPSPSPPPPVEVGAGRCEEDAAAITIQSAFRSYLARKALCALRGMVKLQAMVRGQLVRRQAKLTLRRMQALVDAQRRARAERLRLLDDDHARQQQQQQLATATPRPPSRRSPQHPRSRKPTEAVERGLEENVKIVEVDNGGVAHAVRRGGGGGYSTTPSRTPAMAELYQKVSPTPSAVTDASARTLSGRFGFDDASLGSASACEPARRGKAAWRADHAPTPPPFPSYMANTESSRAKARSQSAPRQRLSWAPDASAASPSPSCGGERPLSGGGARRRASLDPLDLLPGAHAAAAAPRSSAGRMERCASRAMALARGGASVPGSECGSSSTVGHRGGARGMSDHFVSFGE